VEKEEEQEVVVSILTKQKKTPMKKRPREDVDNTAEAVAAKLSGRIECPVCRGTGVMVYMWSRKREDCIRCGGKKYIRPILEKYKDE